MPSLIKRKLIIIPKTRYPPSPDAQGSKASPDKRLDTKTIITLYRESLLLRAIVILHLKLGTQVIE